MEGDLLGGDFGAAAETPRPPQQLGGGGGDPSDPISQLMAMFPTVDRGVVEMVFNDMAGGSIERATESLLQITDDSVDDLAVAATEQAGSDELLALQMLQQMMNEEDMAKADADKVFSKIQHDAEKKEAFKNTPKGVREAFVRNLEKMKMRAMGKKGAGDSSSRDYKQHYGALLDEDEAMKV